MQLGLPFAAPADAGVAPVGGPPVAVRERDVARPVRATDPIDLRDVVYVRHRRARRYVLRVDERGGVRVTIPRGGSRREAEAFAQRHTEWIAGQRARAAAEPPVPRDRRRSMMRQAAEQLVPRLHALAARHGLSVSRVSIRDQRTRWGSCGRNGHICLNWRLLLMPDWVSEYVLIHELMHLRRLDHSPAFWRLVAAACPGYLAARGWLRAHAGLLR